MYTRDELLSLNGHDVTPARAARKTIFRPLRQRRHTQRLLKRDEARRPNVINAGAGLRECSFTEQQGGDAVSLIADERLDVLV